MKGPDAKPYPNLVERWTVSPDGMEWRFRLRPGLRFHSGARCDAAAVHEALNRLRWGFYEERQSWYWDAVDKVEIEPDDELRFRLHHPHPNLPSLLWGTHTAIFNEALRASQPEAFGDEVADGTGPFRLETWSPDRVVAHRWDAYPGSPAPFLRDDPGGGQSVDAIEWFSVPDECERLEQLERGGVHVLHGPVANEVARLESDARFTVIRHGQSSNFYLALNWEATELSFDDLAVRQAISLSIDRERLVESGVGGFGTATWGPLPRWDPMYEPRVDARRASHVASASQLLDSAGWRRADRGLRARGGRRMEFECVIQDDDVHRRVAQGVAEQLASIGINMQLRPLRPFRDFYSALEKGPRAFINKWLWQDGMDAIIGFSASWCRPFPNAEKASVPELDDAFHAWVRARDEAEMRSAASRAQMAVADRLPYIPLLTPEDIWVVDRRVRGFKPHAATLYPFYHTVRIENQRS